jgi:outer membrane protein assembly factor BamE (lipoprotein component of BamABCDE complex)
MKGQRMRRHIWLIGVLGAMGLAAGCSGGHNIMTWNPFYKRPDVEPKFAKVMTGMEKDEVVKILGKPTSTVGHELWYIYDDPNDPVRLRFVLDDSGAVAEKYYETKVSLQEKMKLAAEGRAAPEPTPGEEPRQYPGGPMKQFQTK